MNPLKCGDFGLKECDFEISGATSEEVKINLFKHFAENHEDFLKELSEDKSYEIEKQIENLFKSKKGYLFSKRSDFI